MKNVYDMVAFMGEVLLVDGVADYCVMNWYEDLLDYEHYLSMQPLWVMRPLCSCKLDEGHSIDIYLDVL